MSPRDDAGPTYRLVLALYAATVVAAAVVSALAARDASTALGAVGAVGSWLGSTVLVAAALARLGTPSWLRPRALYAAGRSWLPTLGGLGLVAAGVAVGSLGPAAPLLVGGAIASVLGWFLRVMGRNAEARARLAGSEPLTWRARPARRRRYVWYAAGGLSGLVVLGAVLWLRDPSLLGAGGLAFAFAAQGANETQYWLGDTTLVYGNPQVRYLLDAGDIAGVEHDAEGAVTIAYRGWRPARTMDASDLDDPEAVVAALERFAGGA
ncbi:hypothetical protein [Haloglomus litoreum]|uniref:hypothetical protein n=1 Tax=Haloglomus litoreum TaxID=3034026 RepID=UPI0023E88C32|nr:hypothetical protein [Haloglomus sp. DT116]